MATLQSIRLPLSVLAPAKKWSKVYNRSLPKQIEHWVKIGQIMEENPDIPFFLLQDTLFAMEEVKNNETSEYIFG